MKIPNKRELQQIVFNPSLDFEFPEFINLYKKCTVKSYSFLVIDTTPASDNSLRFRRNLRKNSFLIIDTTPTSDNSLRFRKNLVERI